MKIRGYRRPDGKIGIRNHVLIIPTCSCSLETCRSVASIVDGTVYLDNQNGCGQVPPDIALTTKILSGYAASPNVYGSVVIGLGCEGNIPDEFVKLIKSKTSKPLVKFEIQEEGGTLNTISKAAAAAQKMMAEASSCEPEMFDISELIMGTECGGSDPTSGIAANPAIGNLSDRLVDMGATSILCETTEFIGAEHILAKRATTPEIGNKILGIVNSYEQMAKKLGLNIRDGQPTPGNIKGGITTNEEKSLGCIHKGGTKEIVDVVGYADVPTKKGLVIMDTPGYDMASVAALAAGGCHVIVFSTGRGTPTGCGIVPVLKVTGNPYTYEKMKDNIDVDLSGIIRGNSTVEEEGKKLFEEIHAVANGKQTKAESYRFNEIAFRRLCDYG